MQWVGQPPCEDAQGPGIVWGFGTKGLQCTAVRQSLAPVSASSGPAGSPPWLPMAGVSLVTHGSGLTRAPGHPWLLPSGPCLHLTLELQYPSYLPGQIPSNHCHADLTATCPPSSSHSGSSASVFYLSGPAPILSVIPAAFQAPNHWSLSSSWRGSFLSVCPGTWSRTRRLVHSAPCLQPSVTAGQASQPEAVSPGLGVCGFRARWKGPSSKGEPHGKHPLPGRAGPEAELL